MLCDGLHPQSIQGVVVGAAATTKSTHVPTAELMPARVHHLVAV